MSELDLDKLDAATSEGEGWDRERNMGAGSRYDFASYRIETIPGDDGWYFEICSLGTSCVCRDGGPFCCDFAAQGKAEEWVNAYG